MLVTIAALTALSLAPQETHTPPAVHPLAVLYAGEPGSAREAAWLEFLRGRFRRVESTTPAQLLESEAQGFDVVIADGTVDERDGRLVMGGCTRSDFPESWSRPTILIASAGKAVERVSRIGWL